MYNWSVDMTENQEKHLNETFYILILITGLIYFYLIEKKNELSREKFHNLLITARTLSFIAAAYFLINSIVGLYKNNTEEQQKQFAASLLVFIAAIIILSIKGDDIEFK